MLSAKVKSNRTRAALSRRCCIVMTTVLQSLSQTALKELHASESVVDLKRLAGCVQDMFISAGGDGSHFDASHAFGPHITLGFTAASATKGLFAPTDLFIEQVHSLALLHASHLRPARNPPGLAVTSLKLILGHAPAA